MGALGQSVYILKSHYFSRWGCSSALLGNISLGWRCLMCSFLGLPQDKHDFCGTHPLSINLRLEILQPTKNQQQFCSLGKSCDFLKWLHFEGDKKSHSLHPRAAFLGNVFSSTERAWEVLWEEAANNVSKELQQRG